MAQNKRCENCKVRPASPDTPEGLFCAVCDEEAGWENAHSDGSHEHITEKIAAGKRLTKAQKETAEDMDRCWICKPELNRASADYTPRAGTSRAGMRMTVRRGLPATDKAKAVKEEAAKVEGIKFGRTKVDHGVALAFTLGEVKILLVWAPNGRYDYERSAAEVAGKSRKVRNASEALRLIGA